MKRSVLRVLLAFFGGVALASAADLSGTDAGGRPKQFKAGSKAMFGVWFEDGAWHLRSTSSNVKDRNDKPVRVIFSGSVRVVGGEVVIQNEEADKGNAKSKTGDRLTRHKDGKGFDFVFQTFGGVDGIAFKATGKAESISLKLKVNGDDDPKYIFVGEKGKHPDKATFVVPARP